MLGEELVLFVIKPSFLSKCFTTLEIAERKQIEMPLIKCIMKCLYLYTARSRMIWLRFSSSFKEKSSLRNNPFWGKKTMSLAILHRQPHPFIKSKFHNNYLMISNDKLILVIGQ